MSDEIVYPVVAIAWRVKDASNCVIADIDIRGDEADSTVARRIAACLNACRNISTEDLELCGEIAFNRN